MPRVIVGYPLMRAELDRIRAGAPAVDIAYGDLTSQAAADALDDPDLEAVFAPRLPADLSRTPKLRWQQATSAGIDLLAESKPWDRGVTLTNAAGVYAVPIAQYVLAAILRSPRRPPPATRRRRVATGPRKRRNPTTPALSCANRRC